MLRLKEKLTFRCETEEEAKALIERYKQDGRTNGYEVNKVSYQYKEKKIKVELYVGLPKTAKYAIRAVAGLKNP